MTAEQIMTEYGDGVVLIQTVYYHSIHFKSGVTFYFTGTDSDGDITGLTGDIDEVQPVTSYGTGFYLNREGVIATNAHVAAPKENEEAIHTQVVNQLNQYRHECESSLNQLNDQISSLQNIIIQYGLSGTYEYQAQLKETREKRDEMQGLVSALNDASNSNYSVNTHTVSIGIAGNNTYVTKTSDFTECILLKADQVHDVALIQRKDKTTPEKAKVLPLYDTREFDQMSKDEIASVEEDMYSKLYMIAFNLGPSLALTSDGIKAQITQGEVSQKTDKTKIMYTIPSLHGSSGSPVLSKYGQVVAVNFAGLDTTQGFNYGVRIQYLWQLIKEADVDIDEE